MAFWYDLNGAHLRVDAADAELVEPLAVYLDDLRIERRGGAPAFTLVVERGAPRCEPANAELLCEGPLPEASVCRISVEADSRWLVIPDRLSLEYSTAERTARMHVAPGYEALVGGTAAIHAIDAALCATGQTLVHAAALRLLRQNKAFVLFAPSGAGKTTTALALALQGFALLTDDATVLAANLGTRGRANVWGLPRPPKIHCRTAEILPAVGRLLGPHWNEEGEQSIPQETLKSVIDLTPGRTYPLAAMVLLGRRVVGAHVLRPMRKAELFVHFANDNVTRAPQGVLNEDLGRFQKFVNLVASTPAYELNVGSDLFTLGETITAVLGAADQAILRA